MTFTYGSLFSGIGGIDLGLDRAGMTCKWQIEIDEDCRDVLNKHWPNVPKFDDIRNWQNFDLQPVDLICGGFPCQPHSVAGQRRGAADDRDLWPEYYEVVKAIRPRWIFIENVPGIQNTILDEVLFCLEAENYTAATFNIPAIAFGADHRRYRIFVVAHSYRQGVDISRIQDSTRQVDVCGQRHQTGGSERQAPSTAIDILSPRLGPTRRTISSTETRGCHEPKSNGQAEPRLDRTIHGVSSRVDRHRTNNRLKMLGNAVYPAVAEFLGKIIMETEKNGQRIPRNI